MFTILESLEISIFSMKIELISLSKVSQYYMLDTNKSKLYYPFCPHLHSMTSLGSHYNVTHTCLQICMCWQKNIATICIEYLVLWELLRIWVHRTWYLVALRKLPMEQRGSQAIDKFATKRVDKSEHQRSGNKWKNVACYSWKYFPALWSCRNSILLHASQLSK